MGDLDLGDRAVDIGVDRVLHLHGFEGDDWISSRNRVSDRHVDAHDGALHWRGDRTIAAARSSLSAGSSPRPFRSCRDPNGLWDPQGHVVLAAVDLDRNVLLGERFVAIDSTATGRAHAGQVEAVLDPVGRMGVVLEGLGFQDGDVGGNGRRDAFDLEFADGAQCTSNRSVAVSAPHDQLADQVVVVLADLVAGLIAGVEASSETVGNRQRRDRPRRWEKGPFCGVFGVDADLDRVPGDCYIVLGEGKLLASSDP